MYMNILATLAVLAAIGVASKYIEEQRNECMFVGRRDVIMCVDRTTQHACWIQVSDQEPPNMIGPFAPRECGIK